MSSAGANTWQAVYRWSAGAWRPVRGTFSGLQCADCRIVPAVLYRKGDGRTSEDVNYYCEEHKP